MQTPQSRRSSFTRFNYNPIHSSSSSSSCWTRYRSFLLLSCLVICIIGSMQIVLGTFGDGTSHAPMYINASLFGFAATSSDSYDATSPLKSKVETERDLETSIKPGKVDPSNEHLEKSQMTDMKQENSKYDIPTPNDSIGQQQERRNTLSLPSEPSYLPPTLMGIVLMNRTTFQCETYGVFGVHDQKHGKGPRRTDFDRLFRLYYLSVCEANLNAIVFHDLPSEWTTPYERNQVPGAPAHCNVKLQYVDVGNTPLHTFDLRWHIYREYLKTHRHEYIVTTDVSDVRFDDNPFPYMHSEWLARQTAIFLGLDDDWPEHSDWFKTRYENCQLDYQPYGKQKSLNAGVVGGRYESMVWLLERMTNMSSSYIERKLDVCMCLTSDMIVLNDIFYNQDIEQKDNSVLDRERWHDHGLEINPHHSPAYHPPANHSPFVPEGTVPVPWRWMTGRPFVGPYRNSVRINFGDQYIRHKTNINRTEEMQRRRTAEENQIENLLYTNYNMEVEKDAKKKNALKREMERQAQDQIRRIKNRKPS